MAQGKTIGEGIAEAGMAIGFGLLVGLALSGGDVRIDINERVLAEGFEKGMARAACIEAGRKWFIDECKPVKLNK